MQAGAPPSRLSPCVPNRFESDLRAMTGRPLNWYWKAMWVFVSPLIIIGLFIFYLSDYILTGTLQYQAWDATQVCDAPAGLRKSRGNSVTSEHSSSVSDTRNHCCAVRLQVIDSMVASSRRFRCSIQYSRTGSKVLTSVET